MPKNCMVIVCPKFVHSDGLAPTAVAFVNANYFFLAVRRFDRGTHAPARKTRDWICVAVGICPQTVVLGKASLTPKTGDDRLLEK